MKNLKIIILFLLPMVMIKACKGPSDGSIKTAVTVKESSNNDRKITSLIKSGYLNIICIRHAEKEADSDNPYLTAAGKERAMDFVKLLEDVKVDAIYSSEYNRTLETVMPLSQNRQVATKIYDPRNLSELRKNLLYNHKNQTVVVVGHSNSTPQFANLLLEAETYPQFDEKDYDNLILVSVDNNEDHAEAQMLHFGKESIVE